MPAVMRAGIGLLNGGWKRALTYPAGSPTSSRRSPCRVETIVPALFLILVFMLSFTMLSQSIYPSSPPEEQGQNGGSSSSNPGQAGDGGPSSGSDGSDGSYETRPPKPVSEFSFDIDQIHVPRWMAALPDNVSLTALSIPGTHDTLTHSLAESHPRLHCQNHNLSTQLNGGIRYIDVRARLNTSRHDDPSSNRPGNLLIYHSYAWTGYSFADVMTTVFSFLDQNPEETILMRLQREGGPVHVGPDGRHILSKSRREVGETVIERVEYAMDRRGKSWGADPDFEAAFNYHRTSDPDTSAGFDKHFYLFPSSLREDDKKTPTLGQARGKVILLQDFDGAQGTRNVYGLPWDERDDRLRIEDLWILTGPRDMERKWDAVKNALDDAAAAEDVFSGPLFLSHLSASVAVDPVDVAAGIRDPDTGKWHEGINDRTGKGLRKRNDGKDEGKTGVLMADFPGKNLIAAIVERNAWALPTTDGHAEK